MTKAINAKTWTFTGSPRATYESWNRDGSGAGVGWRANEPSGMTEPEDRNFDSIAEAGWGDPNHANFSTIADASSNHGGANIGRITFPSGFSGGSAPCGGGAMSPVWGTSAIWTTDNARHLYVTFEIRFSANWQAHATGTNKIFFLTSDDVSGGGNPCFLSLETNLESGTAPPQFMIRPQGTGSGSQPSTTLTAEVPVTYGQWDKVEAYLVFNTDTGVEDGEAHLWVNGTKTQEDFSCHWGNGTGLTWDNVRWEPTWGGAGGTVSANMWQEISRISVGVKA